MSSTSSGVFPYPPPEGDTELTDRIQKLATYVARNGKEFESKVKEKEQSNPQFSFLADTSSVGYLYYQWYLFCLTHQYTPEQIEGMDSKHKSKLLGLLPKGVMELSIQDSTQLLTMLQSSNGSKDTIKTARKWIVDRCQCIVNIGVIIRKYVISVAARSQQKSSSSSTGTTTDADGVGGSNQADNSFSQILFTIYILNDLFYNTRLIKVGPFYSKLLQTEITVDATSILYENLPLILRTAYDRATEDSQRERIVKLVELWKNKCFITAERASVLLNSLTHPFLPPEPPLVPLSNHYIDPADIAPSNAVVKPTPPPIAPPMLLPPHIDNTNIHPPFDHHFTGMINPPMMSMFPPPFFPLPPPLLPNAGFVPGVVYPPMAPLMPTSIVQPSPIVMMDLGKIPVGNMANIVKAAKKAGHQPYTTIDVMMYASHAAPYVEPGRLEAKLSEFYKHADLLMKKLASGSGNGVALNEAVATASSSSVKVRQVEHPVGHSNEEEVWEKYVASATAGSVFTEDDDRYRGGSHADRERDNNVSIYGRYNKFARLDGVDGRGALLLSEQQSSADREIAEDNVGHKLLRGLGWQQGSGLGTEGHTGIVEPIRSEGSKLSKDRTGLGLAAAAASYGSMREDGGVDVSSYRSQLSSQYHSSRTTDRDRR